MKTEEQELTNDVIDIITSVIGEFDASDHVDDTGLCDLDIIEIIVETEHKFDIIVSIDHEKSADEFETMNEVVEWVKSLV